MKNNRGFTLVEMLGVLIILIMVFMIVFPSLTKMIKDTNVEIDAATVSVIEGATADFLAEKSDVYPRGDNYTYCITLSQLIDNANLTEKQISSLTDTDMIVKTTFVDRKPVYVLTKTCTTVAVDIDFTLIGENNMSFEVGVGGQYVEPGATALNKAGQTVSYTITITNSKKETVAYVDTTRVDIYTVKYSATIDGEDYSIERIVKVVDTTAPTIAVNPTSEIIAITNNTYNVLSGVTASDNSGDIPTINASTNLSLGQTGTYSITYTATDSSGNKKTAKRTVIVTDRKIVKISIGSKTATFEINSGTYVDVGATAQDVSGNDLTSQLTKTIKKGTTVVTQVAANKLDTYYITYSIVKDNVTYSETRTVKIVDTTKPVITGATNTTIYTTDNTFNVMTGVSVTDNSGETITINTSSNLTLGIIGTYNVTYTATDSSGNTATVVRVITVNQKLEDNYLEYTFDTATKTITSYNGTEINITIPDKIIRNGIEYIVETLGPISFRNKNMQHVIIGEYITSLGYPSPTIPDLLSEINDTIAHNSNCPSGGSTSIFNRPFSRGNQNVSFEVSENNSLYKSIDGSIYTKDGSWLIVGKGSDETITIADNTIGIGDDAFFGKKITSIIFPNTLKYINMNAFSDITGINTLTLPDSLEQIQRQAFRNNSLTSINIGSGIKFIGINAFKNTIKTQVSINTKETDVAYYNCSIGNSFEGSIVNFLQN